MKTIIATEEEIRGIFSDEFNKALANMPHIKPQKPVVTIRSISQGADFIGCSKPKFQELKLSGDIRVYSTGRKFLIYSDELLEDLAKIQQAKTKK
jgi:hypothetical protein